MDSAIPSTDVSMAGSIRVQRITFLPLSFRKDLILYGLGGSGLGLFRFVQEIEWRGTVRRVFAVLRRYNQHVLRSS